jgi:hypothetical protein|tara:strand:+ start:181 stop:417 length:237 start_codon:yes stop_codon:yes gene_type:complete
MINETSNLTGDTMAEFNTGDMVVVSSLNNLVGEVTKKSLNGDKEYDYMVHYEVDGACEWCEASDLREATQQDNWSLTC